VESEFMLSFSCGRIIFVEFSAGDILRQIWSGGNATNGIASTISRSEASKQSHCTVPRGTHTPSTHSRQMTDVMAEMPGKIFSAPQ
jgi:hypothetical protein